MSRAGWGPGRGTTVSEPLKLARLFEEQSATYQKECLEKSRTKGLAMAKKKRARKSKAKRSNVPADDQPRVLSSGASQPVLDFHNACRYNRDVFLLKNGVDVFNFIHIDACLGRLITGVASKPDEATGRSHAGLAVHLLLVQRQSLAAMNVLAAAQAYQAWVLFRPALEAVLIVGKWLDDPANAETWRNRRQDRAKYQRAYQGKKLRSKSLSKSRELQILLKHINDEYVHANPDVLFRHLREQDVDQNTLEILMHHFDGEQALQVHVCAFLHVFVLAVDSLRQALEARLGKIADADPRVDEFENTYRPRVAAIIKSDTGASEILSTLGLWDLSESCGLP